MNRVHQPRTLVVLGLDAGMGTAAGADELAEIPTDAERPHSGRCSREVVGLLGARALRGGERPAWGWCGSALRESGLLPEDMGGASMFYGEHRH